MTGTRRTQPADRRGLRRRMIWASVLAVAVTLMFILLDVVVHHIVVNVMIGLALTLVVVVSTWVIRAHGSIARQAYWFTPDPRDATPTSGSDFRLFALRRDIRATTERGDQADRVQPLLAELVRSRLRDGHDIDLDSDTDADAAERILGSELYDYVTADREQTRGRRSMRSLTRLVHQVEDL